MEVYHSTKTIFGKDQKMPATGYISYLTLSASRRIISGSECIFNVDAHLSLRIFPLTSSQTRRLSAQQRHIWMCCFCLFLCLLSTYFVGLNYIILQYKHIR